MFILLGPFLRFSVLAAFLADWARQSHPAFRLYFLQAAKQESAESPVVFDLPKYTLRLDQETKRKDVPFFAAQSFTGVLLFVIRSE